MVHRNMAELTFNVSRLRVNVVRILSTSVSANLRKICDQCLHRDYLRVWGAYIIRNFRPNPPLWFSLSTNLVTI